MTTLCVSLLLPACAPKEASCVSDSASVAPFDLSGTVTASSASARRVVVQAVDNCDRAVAETTTDDAGYFKLRSPGNVVKVKAVSRLVTSNFANRPSGAGTSYVTACTGAASWDFNIVDNTAGQGWYGYSSSGTYSSTSSQANLDIPLVSDGSGGYKDRSAAPFLLANTIVHSLEQVCQANPGTPFPKLMINWSSRNAPVSGQKSSGAIGTSHFTVEGGLPQLYILGREDMDSDELDDHVVAHEFGHYLEYGLYRSDTLGGSHSISDRLDPRVAFGEGYGNAFSAMATGDEVYVDRMSSGVNSMDIGESTKGRYYNGIHNERSVQYFLWKLYQNNTERTGGSFSKIHEILKNHQRVAPAFTTLQTFAAYYNARFGASSESLQSLWETELESPYDALCQATHCSGGGSYADTPDLFDAKGLIGTRYAVARTYNGVTRDPAFWNPYRNLAVPADKTLQVFSATLHDVIDPASYGYPFNKFGYVRWYTYEHTRSTGTVTINVQNLANGGKSCAAKDWLDLYAYGPTASGLVLVAADENTTGCPSVSFQAESGKKYLLTVNGALYSGGNVSSYDLRIQVSP